MELGELLKVYGPLAIGWVIAAYLMKFVLDRYDTDIKSKIELAASLNRMADMIRPKDHE